MVQYSRINTIILIVTVAVANGSDQGVIKHQNELDLPLSGITENYVEKFDTQINGDKVEEYYKTRKSYQRIQLDVKDPTFKELKLVLRNKHRNGPNYYNCKNSGDCEIGRTNNNARKENVEVIRAKSKKKHTKYNDNDMKKYDEVLNIHKNIVNDLKIVLKSNANAPHELRCDGKDCSSVKDTSNKDDQDNDNKQTISSDNGDDRIDFEQEAIDDWLAYSNIKKQCTGNDCVIRHNASFNYYRSDNKDSLRKLKEVPEYTKLFSFNDIKSDFIEENDVKGTLKAYDLVRMFERLREAFIEKLMWYIEDPSKNIADLYLDQETTAKLNELKHVYQNNFGKISDTLSEAVRVNLKNFIKNQVFQHKNDIDESRELFERQTDEETLDNQLDLFLRMRRRFFPRTKRQRMRLSMPINFHAIHAIY